MFTKKMLIGGLVICLIFILTSCGSKNVKKAKEFMDVKMYDQALQLLQQEIMEHPNNEEAHFLSGKVYLLTGNEAKAQEAFERTLLLRCSSANTLIIKCCVFETR